MRISRGLLITSVIAAGFTVTACSPKKTFNGSAKTAAAPADDDLVPEEPEDEELEEEEEEEPVEEEPAEEPIFKDCLSEKSGVFVGELFRLETGNENLEPLTTLSPLRTICLKQLNIYDRPFTAGFPGVESLIEWFGLKITSKITITNPGTYQFRLNSDDGSRMSINGVEIIDNDGQHSVASKGGSIELSEGTHDLEVRYFQGPGDRIALELFWTPPGESESFIPLGQLSRP